MLKWVVTLFVALAVLATVRPWLAQRGLGHLPGDVTLRVRGREVYLPFTSTLLLSLAVALLGRVL